MGRNGIGKLCNVGAGHIGYAHLKGWYTIVVQKMAERAVAIPDTDHVASAFAGGENGCSGGSHTGRKTKRHFAVFQCGDLILHNAHGGIGNAAVGELVPVSTIKMQVCFSIGKYVQRIHKNGRHYCAQILFVVIAQMRCC